MTCPAVSCGSSHKQLLPLLTQLPCRPCLFQPAAQFVLLAGAGTLAKSMAKGMGRPCFRVIQTHFSGAPATCGLTKDARVFSEMMSHETDGVRHTYRIMLHMKGAVHCSLWYQPASLTRLVLRTPNAPAATNNVGDVAAKEEVWEVAAQVRGRQTLQDWRVSCKPGACLVSLRSGILLVPIA